MLLLCLCLGAPLHGQQEPAGPSLTVMGFGDVGYVVSSRDMPEGFLLGQMVGHAIAGLTDRLTFFGEVSATARATAYSFEVERMILRYAFGDPFKLSVGRYHTPVSYWNTAYHHGSWLQTSVARPELTRFGSSFLPVHFIGLLAEGNFPALPLGLGYALGVGNGRGSVASRGGDAGDVDGSRAWLAQLTSRPAELFGLQLGGSVYFDRAHPEDGPPLDERILSAHLALERESPEMVAEYVRSTHEPADAPGEALDSDAFYVQLAYRLPGAGYRFKPYVRLERVEIPADNGLLAPLQPDYRAGIAGVRFDPVPYAALKLEYRREEVDGPDAFDSLYLQASFTIPGTSGGGAPAHLDHPAGFASRLPHR